LREWNRERGKSGGRAAVTAKVKLCLPKGSLERATFSFFERAGYKIRGQERTYRPVINDSEVELKLLRPQEIPIFVAEGMQDIGVTGYDWIRETNADVQPLVDLEYGKVKVVLAVPKQNSTELFQAFCESLWKSGRKLRISTEYLNLAQEYLLSLPVYKQYFSQKMPRTITPWWTKGENKLASIYLSFGATEAKPPEDADAVVDVTETGTTLEQNNLVPVDTILESSSYLIANRRSLTDASKKEKIMDILAMLKGVVEGSKKLHIFLNVRRDNLQSLLESLPALKKPTVSQLSDENWYAVNTVVDEDFLIKAIPKLRKLAQGLVVHEPRQILPLEEIAEMGDGKKLGVKDVEK
jgi:ATP phosphoribosyltransferase